MSDYTVKDVFFVDTNVLFSSLTRDVVLTCFESYSTEVYWSTYALDELRKNLTNYMNDHSDPDAASKVERLIAQINGAFPRSLITSGGRADIGTGWPDPKDEQIVRDAVQASATVLLTRNTKDFPEALLVPLGLRAITPDQYLTDLLSAAPARLIDTLDAWLTQRHRPAYTRASLVERLGDVGLVRFAEALSAAYDVP